MKRVLLWGGLIVAAVLFLPHISMGWHREIPVLVMGWVRFLERNLAAVTWNPGLITTGFICSVVLLLLGHGFLKVLFKQAQALGRANEGAIIPWRAKWTVSLYCGIWLLFMIAFGAAGLFRHITWLRAYDHPWYRERGNACVTGLKQVEGAIEQWALEHKKAAGDPVIATGSPSILDYLRGGELPACPAGGTIEVTVVGEPPTCTTPSHSLSGY